MPDERQVATFAAGCFWGVEDRFRAIDGVTATEVGYTGGTSANPTYRQVCRGRTGHAEAVRVTFDPQVVAYDELVAAFFAMHDPRSRHRQGFDVGSQYRSGIYVHSTEQRSAAEAAIAAIDQPRGLLRRRVTTEVAPAGAWYRAEEYHQQYNERHGRSCGRRVDAS
jgi:peptide-methionine (S)-S-oxide reductase